MLSTNYDTIYDEGEKQLIRLLNRLVLFGYGANYITFISFTI
jgi:hypothetical protein